MITIDGVEWDFPCDIERESEITASELSGMLLNRNYFNDPIATYIRYTVTMAIPVTKMNEYAELYEILSDPVAGHTFTMPYNTGTKTFNGRVEVVSDNYYKGIWRGTQFTVISNEPIKVPT